MTTPVSQKTCYLPNGTAVDGNAPCLSQTADGHSACCDPVNDVCLDNGLCYSSWHGVLFRRTCTDQSWGSSSCSPYCQNTYTNAGVGVFARDQNHGNSDQISCCIGWNTTSGKCLDNRAEFKVRSGNIVQGFGSLTASVGTATATATGCATNEAASITSSSNDAQATCTSSSFSSSGTEIGIGLGVGLPLLLAVLALIVMLRREKKRSKDLDLRLTSENSSMEMKPPIQYNDSNNTTPFTSHSQAAPSFQAYQPSPAPVEVNGEHQPTRSELP